MDTRWITERPRINVGDRVEVTGPAAFECRFGPGTVTRASEWNTAHIALDAGRFVVVDSRDLLHLQ